MPDAIVVDAVRHSFRKKAVLDGLSLRVPSGSLFGLLGVNGAGKSTTVKILTGLLRPTSGVVRVLDADPMAHDPAVKGRIGSVLDGTPLFESLTVSELMSFHGRVHGLSGEEIRRRGEELLETFGLAADAGRPVREYSHGMRKKTALALSLIHSPRLLFLDEPFEGIDPTGSMVIRDLLVRLTQRGVTILLTCHTLEIVERIATHIAILAGGRIFVQGTREEVEHRGTLEQVFVEASGAPVPAPELAWIA